MTDLATLQTDVIDVLKDQQITTAKVNDFIRRAEPKLERDLMSDQYGGAIPRQMLSRLETTTDADSALTLPSDFRKAAYVTVGGRYCRQASPAYVPSRAPGYASADAVIDYYAELPRLSALNPTNWLLTVSYDAYLWATCLQYQPWGHEVETAAQWFEWYRDAIRTAKETHDAQGEAPIRTNKDQQSTALYTIIGDMMRFA